MTPGEEIEGIEEKECYRWRRCMVNPGKTEGRDGSTGSRGKFRQGWSLATLPNVAQVPLFSAVVPRLPGSRNHMETSICVVLELTSESAQ